MLFGDWTENSVINRTGFPFRLPLIEILACFEKFVPVAAVEPFVTLIVPEETKLQSDRGMLVPVTAVLPFVIVRLRVASSFQYEMGYSLLGPLHARSLGSARAS